jgi:hypothetical protein
MNGPTPAKKQTPTNLKTPRRNEPEDIQMPPTQTQTIKHKAPNSQKCLYLKIFRIEIYSELNNIIKCAHLVLILYPFLHLNPKIEGAPKKNRTIFPKNGTKMSTH